MPRVLITGAAGFIGMHTSIRYLKEGWEVIGIDNINDYYSVKLKEDRLKEIENIAKLTKSRFLLYRMDLNSNVWKHLQDISFDVVIHLAAQAGVRYSIENPRSYLNSNILGFQSFLEFIEKKKIKVFFYASSSSVYGKDSIQPFQESQACNSPESYYAATKITNELMAYSYFKTKNIASVGLRFFTVYGPWGRPDMAPMLFAKAASENKVINVFNFGNQLRDFTYIDDIVEGIFRLVAKANSIQGAEVFNIGKGSPDKLMDFLDLMGKQFGKKLKINLCEAQLGDVEVTFADTRKLSELTKYRPTHSLETGLKYFVTWYNNYNKKS